MFSSWISKGTNNNKQAQWDALLTEVLKTIKNQLTQQLGQQINEQTIDAYKNSVNNFKRLEDSLVDIKSKYHDIVNKVTLYQENAKRIANSVGQFINSVEKQIGTDLLSIPFNQIQKGISDISAEKVEKQMNYMIRIYQSSMEDMLKTKAQNKQNSQEIQNIKRINKQLQNQLINCKSTKNAIEKKNIELSIKLTELAEKNSFLQATTANLSYQNEQAEKIKVRETELNQKINKIEKQKNTIAFKLKEAENQIAKYGEIVNNIKDSDQQLMQELRNEIKRKEHIYQNTIKKINLQKKNNQQQIQLLKETIEKLNKDFEVAKLSFKPNDLKLNQELQKRIAILQGEKKQILLQLQQNVNKQIMRQLFLKFDDERNQWQIKKDIKKQIYGLLGLQIKNQQEDNTSKKWFGIF